MAPDSRRLAYLRGQVYVDGSAVTHSPSPPLTYSWTPDSAGIAYLAAEPAAEPDPIVADRDYRYTALYVQPLSGGEPRRITIADRHVVSLGLSPDGTRAVYAAQPTPRNRDSFDCDLYKVDLSARSERPLVAQPGRDADPAYSPDGKWIAFHSQGGTLNYFAARHVALVPWGGGAIRYLTRDPNIPIDIFFGGNFLPGRATAAPSITRRDRARGTCWSGRIWPAAESNVSQIAWYRRRVLRPTCREAFPEGERCQAARDRLARRRGRIAARQPGGHGRGLRSGSTEGDLLEVSRRSRHRRRPASALPL